MKNLTQHSYYPISEHHIKYPFNMEFHYLLEEDIEFEELMVLATVEAEKKFAEKTMDTSTISKKRKLPLWLCDNEEGSSSGSKKPRVQNDKKNSKVDTKLYSNAAKRKFPKLSKEEADITFINKKRKFEARTTGQKSIDIDRDIDSSADLGNCQ